MTKGGQRREQDAQWAGDVRNAHDKADEYVKGWFGYLDQHASEAEEVVFQRWMDREGGRAVRHKVALLSTRLTHGQAGGTETGGAGGQRQPQKEQGAQLEPARCDLAGGGGCITDAFVSTTEAGQQDTKEEAVARATAVLSIAEKCPMCQNVHMFSFHRHQGGQFPSTSLSSCGKFRDISMATGTWPSP